MSEVKYVVVYRESERGSDGWSDWIRLSPMVHETLEEAHKELQMEMDWDREYGSPDFLYIYRSVTEGSVVEDSDLPVVRSEDGAGPLSVAVPVERLEVLEGIERRLKDTLRACEESMERAQRIVDEAKVPSIRTLLAQDDVMRISSDIRTIKRYLEEG